MLVELTDDESTDLILRRGDLDVPMLVVDNDRYCADSGELAPYRASQNNPRDVT